MISEANGTRFNNNRLWEHKLHAPYDYANEGLIKHIISPRLVNAKNPFLQYMLKFVESSFIFIMKYVDILQNYFNYNWKNR